MTALQPDVDPQTAARAVGSARVTPRRKLIEVSLPLEKINAESAREKSIRHGHPSTLHLWWARRPLAAARAVLFAQLVDDPSADEDAYRAEARDQGIPASQQDAYVETRVTGERERLHGLLKKLVVWENAGDDKLMAQANAEILRCSGGNPPPILDPFAGGGSIPLEAQRLGLQAHASDLNPVAVLINKALIEIPPRLAGQVPVHPDAAASRLGKHWPKATGLTEDVRRYGQWMREAAEQRIGHLYPKATLPDGTKAGVIAWIWARTVTCPNPACGIRMPLVRSWWLGKKKGKEAYVIPEVVGTGRNARVRYSIGHDPRLAPTPDDDGTVGRTGAVCIACGTAVPLTYIRAEGQAGRMDAQLMATVAEGLRQRTYLAPTPEHSRAALVHRPDDVPEGDLPKNPRDFKTPNYGMTQFADLFTNRQLVALTTFSDLVAEARERVLADARDAGMPEGERLEAGGCGAAAYADAVATYLGLAVSRLADIANSLCRWENTKGQIRNLFTRQAIPMIWDYADTTPFGQAAGSFTVSLGSLTKAIKAVGDIPGTARQADAATLDYGGMLLVSTDPPYYDNIGYSDLSDFFYVWLRRSLQGVYPHLLRTMLVPKAEELVANPYRHGGKEGAQRFFEHGFEQVFARARECALPDYPITVYYAFKQSETEKDGTASTGWETLLQGMIRNGWAITATWPMRSELANRMIAKGNNALASSIVLALRPRRDDAEAISRRGFMAALKAELPPRLRELQQGAIAPVDLAQAAIGPGMAVFSRYARVVENDGSSMSVRTALHLITHAMDEVLTEQEGDFDADTRFCVRWFTQHAWSERTFGEADVLARAVNTSVAGLDRGGVLTSRGNVVRLLAPSDLNPDWDPLTDDRVSIWEGTVRLAKCLAERGSDDAAQLMAAMGQRMDLDAVQELAYLLYTICERGRRTADALLFNGLGTEWAHLSTAAHWAAAIPRARQGDLDLGSLRGRG